MHRGILSVVCGFAVALASFSSMADDDRPPNDEERAAIEQALRAEGYVSWDQDIELDDGRWEVDNARTSDGKKYDLDLDPKTLKVIRRELDD